MKNKYIVALIMVFAVWGQIQAQTDGGILRGSVKDKDNGNVLAYGYVTLVELEMKVEVDINGIYTFPKVPVGTYTLFATYSSYDTFQKKVTIVANKITAQKTNHK